MKFKSLSIKNWRQFAEVSLDIHPRLTVITGANGAGKTTLLGVLTQHFGWSRPLLATPIQRSDGRLAYLTGAISGFLNWIRGTSTDGFVSPEKIGALVYEGGFESPISVHPTGGVEYGVSIDHQQNVQGLNIPSHRILSRYQTINSIPTQGIGAEHAFQHYYQEVMNRYVNGGGHSGVSPMFRMKEALISMATFGEGNRYVSGRPDLLASYLGFIDVLKKVLPKTLGFQDLAIRTPDILLVTKSGSFLLDSVSGGIGSIIDLTWQIYTYSYGKDEFVVVIDEPENHLHPSMQKDLLPNLLSAFPRVQFIVATHSPFIVTAVRDSSVNVLVYRDLHPDVSLRGIAPEKSVYSEKLDHINKSASANEILRDVLGVDSTLPTWAENELGQIIGRYKNEDMTGDLIRKIEIDLAQAGLSDFLPEAMVGLGRRRRFD